MFTHLKDRSSEVIWSCGWSETQIQYIWRFYGFILVWGEMFAGNFFFLKSLFWWQFYCNFSLLFHIIYFHFLGISQTPDVTTTAFWFDGIKWRFSLFLSSFMYHETKRNCFESRRNPIRMLLRLIRFFGFISSYENRTVKCTIIRHSSWHGI